MAKLPLGRRVLEYEMHHSDDNYRTQYSSYPLSQYAKALDALGNILPQITFQDRQIQLGLGDDATISWLGSIQQAI
jgi:hypothetical protein